MLSRSSNPAFTPLGSGTVFGIVFLFRMYVVCHSSSANAISVGNPGCTLPSLCWLWGR